MVGLDPEVAVAGFEAFGIPRPQVTAFGEALDATMGASVLTLYCSAVPELLASWRSDVPEAAGRPGLAVHATADPYQGEGRFMTETGTALAAEVVTVEGLGHW
jgi:hypothetical protein